jgi:Tfp pilus assembly protein PilE
MLSRSGLYLVEFVIVLFVLCIVSVIVFQLFIKGSQISADAYDLNIAVVRAESITEEVLASAGEDAILAERFDNANGGYVLYYDEKWNLTDADKCKYSALISVIQKDFMLLSDVSIKNSSTVLYSIHTERYLGMD